jgi:flavin reductase (DIM6/NTAB) family NADH-FMN oxidoreductase RutF
MDFHHADGFWTAPVELISTGVEKPNIFTMGILGAPFDYPPAVAITPRVHRLSYTLMTENGQFVVNFPTVHMIEEMELCGLKSGRDVDKWELCNFTPIPGDVVDVPMIAECPVNLECIIDREIRLERDDGRESSHVLVIGRIVKLHCHEKYIIDGDLQWDLIDLIFRARPRTWRALGPVIGYHSTEGPPPDDPRLKPEALNRHAADLARLLHQ